MLQYAGNPETMWMILEPIESVEDIVTDPIDEEFCKLIEELTELQEKLNANYDQSNEKKRMWIYNPLYTPCLNLHS
jgi:hypothetical protein